VPPLEEPQTCAQMDILFVIDDSGSMRHEQENLTDNFPRFVEELEAFRTDDGRSLDYRVAVTTTGRDLTEIMHHPLGDIRSEHEGPNGAFVGVEACGAPGAFMQGGPEIADAFSCVANVGTEGAAIEMPLLMLERALTDRVSDGQNSGFLRDDALLAVVILTDEDDCSDPSDVIEHSSSGGSCDLERPSVMPTDHFIEALDRIKGERGRWALSVIAGPGPGTCESDFGHAAEASRLMQMVEDSGDNAVFSSICEGDLSTSLVQAIETFSTACEMFNLI